MQVNHKLNKNIGLLLNTTVAKYINKVPYLYLYKIRINNYLL